MSEQNYNNQEHHIAYRPASEPAVLLFLALPYLAPSIRPFAELGFHLLELQHLLKKKENFSFSSLFSGSIITDKDGLLSAMKNGCDSKYRSMFEMLANLSQIMQFYTMYQEMMPLLQSMGLGTDMGETMANAAGLFSEGNPLTSMLFSGMPFGGMPQNTPAYEANQFTAAANGTSPVKEAISTSTESDFSSEQQENSQDSADSSDSYEDLLALLSPEQQELYSQLRNLF